MVIKGSWPDFGPDLMFYILHKRVSIDKSNSEVELILDSNVHIKYVHRLKHMKLQPVQFTL